MRPQTNKVQKILAEKLEDTARQLKLQTEKMTKRAYQAEALYQTVQQLEEIRSMEELYRYSVEILSEMFGAAKVIFFTYEGGRLLPAYLKGIDNLLEHEILNISNEVILQLKDAGTIIDTSELKDKVFLDFLRITDDICGFHPAIIINTFEKERPLIVIFIGSRQTRISIKEDDIKMLDVFINHIMRIFQNLKLVHSLKEEKDKLRTAIDSMSDGLIYVSPELNIVLMSPSAQKMFDVVEALNKGDNILGALKKFTSSIRIEELLLHEEDLRFELSLPQEGIYYTVLGSKIKDEGNNIIGMMLTLKDISEERYAAHLKTVFMSTVSHKLRTPLTIILEGVNLLHEGLLGELNPKQRSVSEKAFNQAQYLKSLINSLLEFTKTEADIMTVGLHKERRNLKEFFDALLMSFKEQFEQKKILSLLDIKNEGLSLYFDNDRLQTAIGNILDNAVKFNPEKTRIEIKAKQEKNFVEISIKDNGVGIPKQYLKHVFETFTQQDSDFTGQIKGMGLGLYLTHEVIKAHRGEITCNSQLGKGTEFLIKLPVV